MAVLGSRRTELERLPVVTADRPWVENARLPEPVPSVPAGGLEPQKSDPEPESARPTGWLNVRLDLGGEPATGNFRIVVFSEKGPIDKSEELPGAALMKVGPVPAGKKAVFVFPQSAPFGAAAMVAAVPENGDVDVPLRLPKAMPIFGVVVDNTGRPVPEVNVEVQTTLPLEFRKSWGGPESMEQWVTSSGGGGGMRAGYRGSSSHYSFSMASQGVEFRFGAGSDSDGRFKLPYGTAQPAVTLKIKRRTALITEESVVPSSGPLRLVIPVQAEEPKK